MIQLPVDVHRTAGHGKAHTKRDVLKYRGTDMIQQPVDVHGTAGHGKAHTKRDVLKY